MGETFDGRMNLPGLFSSELEKGDFLEISGPPGSGIGICSRQLMAGRDVGLHLTGNAQPLQQEVIKTPPFDVGASRSLSVRRRSVLPWRTFSGWRRRFRKGKFRLICLKIQDFLEAPGGTQPGCLPENRETPGRNRISGLPG